jgi:hypothetical protein
MITSAWGGIRRRRAGRAFSERAVRDSCGSRFHGVLHHAKVKPGLGTDHEVIRLAGVAFPGGVRVETYLMGLKEIPLKRSVGLKLVWILAGAALLTSCSATRALTQGDAAEHARFNAYAGKPVSEFMWVTARHARSAIWSNQLIAWANINTVYLITVAQPCPDLMTSPTIGISSTLDWVRTRTSYVYAMGRPCRIQSIRPVDYLRMQRDARMHGGGKSGHRG